MLKRLKSLPKVNPKRKKPVLQKRRKVKTQLIDPKLPRGKAGKGPLEPTDSTTRVPVAQKKRLKKIRFSNMAERPKKVNPASSYGGNSIMALDKGPGMRSGGVVSNSKATGAAKRGFGKAYMKGKK